METSYIFIILYLIEKIKMTRTEIKKQVIEGIKKTENNDLLEEVLRLLRLENQDLEIYKLNEDQISAVNEAREQIKNGQTKTNEEANDEIDKWLKK